MINSYSLVEFEGLLKRLHTQKHSTKEDNLLLSPAVYDPNKCNETERGSGNYITSNSIWLDFDGGDLTPEAFVNLFPKVRMTIFNTFSSTKDDLRYRVFIPTSSHMDIETYKSLTAHILIVIKQAGYVLNKKSHGSELKSHGLDLSKMGPVNIFYLPCQPKDLVGRYFRKFSNGRRQLDVNEWIKMIEPNVEFLCEMEPSNLYEFTLNTSTRQTNIDQARAKWIESTFIPGTGHNAFFVLAGSLAAAGCDEHDVRCILHEEARRARNQAQRKNEIEENIRSLMRKGAFYKSYHKNTGYPAIHSEKANTEVTFV